MGVRDLLATDESAAAGSRVDSEYFLKYDEIVQSMALSIAAVGSMNRNDRHPAGGDQTKKEQ